VRLCADHERLEAFLRELEAKKDDRSAALRIAAAIASLGRVHHEYEEAVFLPWLVRLGLGEDATHLVGEHRSFEENVRALCCAIVSDSPDKAKHVETVCAELRGHIAHEGRLFEKIDYAP
jgi:hypothetical protein